MDIIKDYPFLQQVADRIKDEEGFRLTPYTLNYKDADNNSITEGFQTGGWGHKIQKGEEIPTTKEGWNNVFNNDFKKAVEGARKLVDIDKIDSAAFGVVTEMVYQMGHSGTSKFKKTIDYINKGQYKEASKEMLNSNWAKQTSKRATRLSTLMGSINNR